MGGINKPPTIPPTPAMDGFQKGWTQGVWNIIIPFFQSESFLETACLTELNSGVPDWANIANAQASASSALAAVGTEISLTNSNVSTVHSSSLSDSNYFLFQQLPLLYSMQATAQQYVNNLTAPSIATAATALTLQDSMAKAGSNSAVRTEGILMVQQLITLLQNHLAVVQAENAM